MSISEYSLSPKKELEFYKIAYPDKCKEIERITEELKRTRRERNVAREIVGFSDRNCEFCKNSNEDRKKDETSKICMMCDRENSAEGFEWDEEY